MGRKSKRLHVPANTEEKIQHLPGRFYKAGIYARLSVKRDEKNDSIDVQVEIAKKFVEDWNADHADKIEVVDCYKDLGKTGTSFERDEFKRLMQDVRLGDVNCVIVKDLSRFGRNYLEAGNYIDKIFPFLGVRFIAVADGYDTGIDESHAHQMATEIKNLVSDMYAKDFSARARLSLEQRRQEGSYVGGPPPYGYKAVWEGKIRRLEPDEKTAEIVKSIYNKFVETESYKAVADYLNGNRINPPSVYHKSGEVLCPPDLSFKGWDKGYVEILLKNETYIGRLVQGKTSISPEKERKQTGEEQWIIKEQAHIPLVEMELFRRAESIWKKIQKKSANRKHSVTKCPIGENIFEGVLFCGVCGRKMTRHSHVRSYADGSERRVEEYSCLNATSTKTNICQSPNYTQDRQNLPICSGQESGWRSFDILQGGNFIRRPVYIAKSQLTENLFSLLETEFALCLKRQREYEKEGREILAAKKRDLESELQTLQREKKTFEGQDSLAYMAYRRGEMTSEELAARRLQRKTRLQELSDKEAEIQRTIQEWEKKEKVFLSAVRALVRLKGEKVFTKELVAALIERICIFPGKRMEVVFTFEDAFWKVGAAE